MANNIEIVPFVEAQQLSNAQIPVVHGTYGEKDSPKGQKTNQWVRPRFVVLVDGVVWPVIEGNIDMVGLNLTGQFTIHSIYTIVGQADDLGSMKPDSPLGKLLDPAKQYGKVNPETGTQDVQPRILVEFYGGHTTKEDPKPEDLHWLWSGYIDRIVIQVNDNLVTITGRDPSVVFHESYTHTQFRNKTVAEAVAYIANKYQFDAYIVDQGIPLGSTYDYERIDFEDHSAAGISNWELLQKFASYSGARVFCIGRKLYFLPFFQVAKYLDFYFGPDSNIEDLRMEKNFSAGAGRISVEVASTDVKKKSSIVAKAGVQTSESGSKGAQVTHRIVVSPNMDPETAGLQAEYRALILAQKEYIITIETSGHFEQWPLHGIKLTETGSIFNRYYQISRVLWEFGIQTGWHASISGIDSPGQINIPRPRGRFGLVKAAPRG